MEYSATGSGDGLKAAIDNPATTFDFVAGDQAAVGARPADGGLGDRREGRVGVVDQLARFAPVAKDGPEFGY